MDSPLSILGPVAVSHQKEVDEVKKEVGITHNEFDCWIYHFLQNVEFKVHDAVKKVNHRLEMEKTEVATYEFTDYMREFLKQGVIQEIGTDKEGRVIFYLNTRRHVRDSKRREEQLRIFDMCVSYGTRLRPDNKRCEIVMIINHKDASTLKNFDLKFQRQLSARLRTFYPGSVVKSYACHMGSVVSALLKPVFAAMPKSVTDRICIVSDSDLKKGKLLEIFDESVFPVELGGKNECDGQENWNKHAENIEKYYAALKVAVGERGLSVKEWELETITKQTESVIDPSMSEAKKE